MFRTVSADRLPAAHRRRFWAAPAVALTLGLSVVTAAVAPTAATAQAAPRDAGTVEAEFISGVNALRAANGLPDFIVDTEIRPVAMSWTVKMADAAGISHNPNLGKEVTAPWCLLGENVGTGGDASSVQGAFEASIGHRLNLLNPLFTHLAVTVVVRGDWIYVTQQFRRPSGCPPPASGGTPKALALVAPPKPVVKATTVKSTKSAKTRRTVRSTTQA